MLFFLTTISYYTCCIFHQELLAIWQPFCIILIRKCGKMKQKGEKEVKNAASKCWFSPQCWFSTQRIWQKVHCYGFSMFFNQKTISILIYIFFFFFLRTLYYWYHKLRYQLCEQNVNIQTSFRITKSVNNNLSVSI